MRVIQLKLKNGSTIHIRAEYESGGMPADMTGALTEVHELLKQHLPAEVLANSDTPRIILAE